MFMLRSGPFEIVYFACNAQRFLAFALRDKKKAGAVKLTDLVPTQHLGYSLSC